MKPNKQETLRQRKKQEDELFGAIVTLKNVPECGNFLKDLCTPAELQALTDRWQVVKLLERDIPYRKIHDMTGVSVTTVGRVARYLADGFGGYRTALSRTSDRKPA